jgi:hypothetical protein
MKKQNHIIISKPLIRFRLLFYLAIAIIIFSLIAVFGLSLITGNKEQTNIGNSLASATEPADINNDNKVDVFDLSILLSKWNTNDSLSDLNKDGSVNVFDLSILLSKWGVVSNPPTTSGLYGTSYNMDAVGNLQIGGASSGQPNTYASVRFRAEQSSPLVSMKSYWVGFRDDGTAISGYGGGNGGKILVEVQEDANGVPSGKVLSSLVHTINSTKVTFPSLLFSNPASLNAGQLYHIVFTNIDANPTVNFISINGTWVSGSVLSPRQPGESDGDYAMLAKYGTGSWGVRGAFTPIIDFTYGNGSRQGQGYMEVEIASQPLINGDFKFMRERFTVSGGSRTVSGGAVRVAKLEGSGSLVVRLEDANGVMIDSFSLSASSIPTLPTNDRSSGVWVKGQFSKTHILASGSTYSIRLSTDSSTTYWSRGIQQGGTAYGFSPVTYFADGFLQFSTNGGGSWSTVSGLGNDGDLQFYLY